LIPPHPDPAKHAYASPARGEGTSQTGLGNKLPSLVPINHNPPLARREGARGKVIMSIYSIRAINTFVLKEFIS